MSGGALSQRLSLVTIAGTWWRSCLTSWRPGGTLTFADCYPLAWRRERKPLTPAQWRAQSDATYQAAIAQQHLERVMFTVIVGVVALFGGGTLGYLYGATVKQDVLDEVAALRRIVSSQKSVISGNAAVSKAPASSAKKP